MDRTYPIQFTDSVAALPPTAPRNHAHMINLAIKKIPKNIMLQDAVVTLLHQMSSMALDMFLANTKAFHVGYIPKSNNSDDCLVIMRRGDKVLVGQYSKHKTSALPALEFQNLIRYSIASDGAWTITDATYNDYFRPSWEDVWAGRTVDIGPGDINGKTTDEDLFMRDLLALQAAHHILSRKFWDDKTFIYSAVF
ncbi:hypothetical protein AA0120_g214 [Alternaria tenuissima]|nr:hypothetical protein AA0120_g214 [Alternaria tenuissima]